MTQRATILGAAVSLARRTGIDNLTRHKIAHAAETSAGSINYHFETMDGLRNVVMAYAVENQILEIIAQGIVAKHPVALHAPEALRKKAARNLTG